MFVTVADPHIRNAADPWSTPAIKALRKARALADKHGARLAVLGDVFDITRPHPRTLAAAGEILCAGAGSVCLVGNHDRDSATPGDHALAPLALVPGIEVVDTPKVVGGVLWVPPAPRGDSVDDYFAAAVAETGFDGLFAFGHFGLATPGADPRWVTSGTLTTAKAAEVMRAAGIRCLISGDWHQRKLHREGGISFVQHGALIPANFGETGPDYGYAMVVDPHSEVTRTFSIKGLRYILTTDPQVAADYAAKGDPDLKIRLRAPKGVAVPEGVDHEVVGAGSAMSATEARAVIHAAGPDAVRATVAEMVREDLRPEVEAKVLDLLAKHGGA